LEKQIEHGATIFTFPWLAHDRKSAQFFVLLALGEIHDGIQYREISSQTGPSRAIYCQAPRHKSGLKGFRGGALVRTGENTFCLLGEWTNFQKIVDARPLMIGILDGFREHPKI
jgi:hypothetical protein